MQRPGRLHISRAIQYMMKMMRVFAADISQAEPGKLRSLLKRESREGDWHGDMRLGKVSVEDE